MCNKEGNVKYLILKVEKERVQQFGKKNLNLIFYFGILKSS